MINTTIEQIKERVFISTKIRANGGIHRSFDQK